MRASDALDCQKRMKLIWSKQSNSDSESSESGDSEWCVFSTDLLLAHRGWPGGGRPLNEFFVCSRGISYVSVNISAICYSANKVQIWLICPQFHVVLMCRRCVCVIYKLEVRWKCWCLKIRRNIIMQWKSLAQNSHRSQYRNLRYDAVECQLADK